MSVAAAAAAYDRLGIRANSDSTNIEFVRPEDIGKFMCADAETRNAIVQLTRIGFPLVSDAVRYWIDQGEKSSYMVVLRRRAMETEPVAIAGAEVGRPDDASVFVHSLVVDVRYRRIGYARMLLDAIREKWPTHALVLDVERNNVGARKCYEKCGFEMTAATDTATESKVNWWFGRPCSDDKGPLAPTCKGPRVHSETGDVQRMRRRDNITKRVVVNEEQ